MKILRDEDFAAFCGTQESQFILPASETRSAVKERFLLGNQQFGTPLPWSKTYSNFRFRPSEVTLWAGINGHGKSLVTSQSILWMLPEEKCLIASLEMQPEATMQRMIRQASGGSEPTVRYIDKFMDYTDGRLWIYNQLDVVEPERIIGMIHYAATELGVTQIVIDSLLKCGIGAVDNYSGQTQFVDALTFAARKHKVHIHLVHHMRKGDKEESMPDKFSIRGASQVADLTDNILIVHRSKMKERKMEAGEEVDPGWPDTVLNVAKQRHGEWEGRIGLWFHKDSQQYVPNSSTSVMPWPEPNVSIMDIAS